MAKLDFNLEKITKQMVDDSMQKIMQQFAADINQIATKYGERPSLNFNRKGPNKWDVTFEVESPELRSEIDAYLKRSN
jgi:hypothetical protein